MKTLVVLATGIGLGGSAAATYRAHRNPMSPQWDDRVGDSRFRRSDLPVGGGVALALAFGSLLSGHTKAAAVLAGAGVGATVGSLGVALVDPLPASETAVDDSGSSADAIWQTPAPAAADGALPDAPSESAPKAAGPASAIPLADDDVAEQEFEQATEAVEHQASYGSPSFDEEAASDDDPSEPEVTGSAPQEGQSPLPEAWFDDKDA